MDTATLPEDPGCYMYKDTDGNVVYVGKAKNLKKRISSYFSKSQHDPKTEAMLKVAEDFDYIVTGTEVEALILENNLIKRYKPKYNIDLRDSKNYAYIRISDDKFPLIGIARKKGGKGEYFGPFVSARERDYVLSALRKIFGLRSCRRMPKRACLRHHIGSCSAPCTGAISEEDYLEKIRNAESILRGHTKDVLLKLKEKMRRHSQNQEFEQALEIRDTISAIENLSEKQFADRKKDSDEDVINYTLRGGVIYIMLFSVFKGTLGDKKEFVFDGNKDTFEEFIVQYYSENEIPSEIILPEISDPSLEDFLSGIRGKKVKLTVPQRGDKKNLLDLVAKNIESVFFRGEKNVEALKKRIHLPENPDVIECFDISHLSGTAMTGSMVQFRYGRPDKRNYRRFKIKTVEGIDDFAAIAEVVRRRYSRLQRESEDNTGNAEMPDLIIIDGGKGQLSSAASVLKDLNLKIPIISVAKREEEIFVPGLSAPLPVKKNDPASFLIQEIRDEAHRFAIEYNRLLRRKEAFEDA
jgi:excinuclease ABC subunit C